MSKIDKNELYKKFAQVSVNNMIMSETSKCNCCKNKLQEFSVFIGEGQRLSTLYSSCCSDCLPIVVNEAIKIGKKDYQDAIKREEERIKLETDVEKYNL